MNYIPVTNEVLEVLMEEYAQSPEELLTALEDALETGEITESQLIEAMRND
jgi:hypothetical protein